MRRFIVLTIGILAGSVCVPAQPLPGTQPLTREGDLAAQMVEGMHRYLDRKTAESAAARRARTPDRERFRKLIGAVDERVPNIEPIPDATVSRPSLIASAKGYRVHAVRWPVLPGVDAEGLMLEPDGVPMARVVALPDADWTPEMLAGLAPGVPPASQFARRLAENGCLVLVPVLIDRGHAFSGNPRIARATQQPHREFIYRMAFEMGRHIIGYEVQKVLAAVDWFQKAAPGRPAGVIGYGEGGLLALYSAALDTRIAAAAVSGYFGPRERLWEEPIYRNVWSLLTEFGDAELARMIAPRSLIIEAARSPESPASPTPGKLSTPPLREVEAEAQRAQSAFEKAKAGAQLFVTASGGGAGDPGSEPALREFLRALGQRQLKAAGPPPRGNRSGFDPAPRLRRQFDQLVEFTQALVRRSEAVRKQFWSKADASSPAKWQSSAEWYRDYLWREVIGRLPDPTEPLAAETRRIYDEPRWAGYEVVLPVWPDVFASGVLLVPKDLKPEERRPVVVCQHGLEGRPRDVIDSRPEADRAYAHFGAQLADRGFIVYAPQNPYIGGIRFRQLQRKAYPLKTTLFSFIVGQQQRTLDWLASLPLVDPERIAFYGLSYGGKTAVRVPPLVSRYALSICSGDFNEWIWKNTSVEQPFSYMYTQEYEMPEWDLGNTFNYSELASLVAPRPFMVERGHRDGVSIDEWVAYEYAKVRRFYAFLGIPERTAIEFFNGPHQIHGGGTFRFLHKFLNWPERTLGMGAAEAGNRN